MKRGSRNLPLNRSGDSPAMTEAVAAIRSWGYLQMRPPSNNQIKIRSLSYYPDVGTMNFDGRHKEPQTGLEALRTLLDKTYGPDRAPQTLDQSMQNGLVIHLTGD
jgi:hypothetical protein